MATILISGDWHADTESMLATERAAYGISDLVAIVQLGDFGYTYTDMFIADCQHLNMVTDVPLFWLRGNRDDSGFINDRWIAAGAAVEPIPLFDDTPNTLWVPDGCVVEIAGLRCLFVGGAASIDRHVRTKHVSWWPDETLTHSGYDRAVDAGKVDVLFSHDCPYGVDPLDERLAHWPRLPEDVERDCHWQRTAVRAIIQSTDPERVYHGHHHYRYEWGMDRYYMGLGCEPDNMHTTLVVPEAGVEPATSPS